MDDNTWDVGTPGRRHPRFTLSCRARIRICKRHYAGSLENISISGARIRILSPLRENGITILLLPDLPPIRGMLRWIEGERAGVIFDQLLDQHRLGRWLDRRLVCEPTIGLPHDHYFQTDRDTSLDASLDALAG